MDAKFLIQLQEVNIFIIYLEIKMLLKHSRIFQKLNTKLIIIF